MGEDVKDTVLNFELTINDERVEESAESGEKMLPLVYRALMKSSYKHLSVGHFNVYVDYAPVFLLDTVDEYKGKKIVLSLRLDAFVL